MIFFKITNMIGEGVFELARTNKFEGVSKYIMKMIF